MILNDFKQVFLCMLLGISGITALARADNWSHRRPNNTAVVQNQWGQAGFRPAVGYQQPLPQAQWNRNNQTQGQSYNHQQQPQWQAHNNNRTQFNYPPTPPNQGYKNPWIRTNQTQYHPQMPTYGQGSYNQTRAGGRAPYNPQATYGQGSHNQTHGGWGQTTNSNLLPTLPNNSYNRPPTYGQGSYNQTHAGSWTPNNPQATYGQGSRNQTHAGWGQTTNSNLYPTIPNNSNNRPSVLPSWSPPTNQTHLYPQLPNKPVQPVQPIQSNLGSNGIPLAPLQPQNPQGSQNWPSGGGQAALSYGPGYYAQPAANPNNAPPSRQGSSNPYANMFN